MLDEWATLIGGIKNPKCTHCNQSTETLELDFEPERDEYHAKVTCHGDTQIFHISKKYAALIYFRLQAKRMETNSDDFQWSLPAAFDPETAARFDGTLHYDFEKALEAKVKIKQDYVPIDQKELDAKAEFEAEFEFEKKRGNVRTINPNDPEVK